MTRARPNDSVIASRQTRMVQPAAPHRQAIARDVLRMSVVTASEILCVAGSLLGSGVFGGPGVADAAGGALAADATLIAPAGSAFGIWSVIYLGLAAYTVWQWLPAQRQAPRHRRIGWLVAGSMVLNAGLDPEVIVSGVDEDAIAHPRPDMLAHALAGAKGEAVAARVEGEAVIVDGTFGLYLGWVSVATCASVTAVLMAASLRPGKVAAQIFAIAVLIVAMLVGVVLARVSGGNVGIGVAMAWGIGWIAVARLSGEPHSAWTAAVAGTVAVVILATTTATFIRRRRSSAR